MHGGNLEERLEKMVSSTLVGGQLKCCLKYEHEGYVELEKGMPRKGETCDTPDGQR